MLVSNDSVIKKYLSLFRIEGVPALVAAMVIARIPTGCISLLLVLFVGESFGAVTAGLTVAAWTMGTALFAPFLGRLVDRGYGPKALQLCALGQVLAVGCLVIVVIFGFYEPVVVACAFVCGAIAPPVAGTTRSLWKTLVPTELLPCAYSFEILLIDVLFVSGPLVASVFIAFNITVWGICLTTGCLIVGSLVLSQLDSVKRYAQIGKSEYEKTSLPVRSLSKAPATWFLMLACMGAMTFSGWLETLLPLFYSSQGRSFQGGLAISVWSIGSIFGVLLFLRVQPPKNRIALVWQLVASTAVYVIVCAFLPFGESSFNRLCFILFGVGLLVSACTNLHYQLGGDLAPVNSHAEMFSWLNTATSAGIALGALLAGNSVEFFGYGTSFQLPVLFVLLSLAAALILAFVSKRT